MREGGWKEGVGMEVGGSEVEGGGREVVGRERFSIVGGSVVC